MRVDARGGDNPPHQEARRLGLLTPEVRGHLLGARKEMLSALRSLIDAALDKMEEKEARAARGARRSRWSRRSDLASSRSRSPSLLMPATARTKSPSDALLRRSSCSFGPMGLLDAPRRPVEAVEGEEGLVDLANVVAVRRQILPRLLHQRLRVRHLPLGQQSVDVEA